MDSPAINSPNTESSQEVQLSRAVSALDLNASLEAVREQPKQEFRFSHDTATGFQLHNNSEKPGTELVSPDGVMTPHSQEYPKPPPPTPASPRNPIASTKSNEPSKLNCVSTPTSPPPAQNQSNTQTKKKRSNGKPKKPPPSGFEEFYADTPITPSDYAVERDLYDPNHDFKDRMQTCIQRFRAKRKLDQVRANIFTKYLSLGGVETGAKQFTGGLDKETIENSTANEIADIQATDFIRTNHKNTKYYDGSDNWVIDFEGVAKGFFSSKLSSMLPIESESQLESYCAVIRNFLNYILQHDVCPEYTADIMAARRVIEDAKRELWQIQIAASKLPGDFNVASSILFGGRYKNDWGFGCWDDNDPDREKYSTVRGFSKGEAERIFKSCIANYGNDGLFSQTMSPDVHIVNTSTKYFQVAEIQFSSHTINQSTGVEDYVREFGHVKPLGIVKFKPWEGPNLEQLDFTDDEGTTSNKKDPEVESFLLEDEALQTLFIGMKLELVIQELNIGLKFIDSVIGLYCSFYDVLLNEKMMDYKEPVASDRPPPTEDDPDVEEKLEAAILNADL